MDIGGHGADKKTKERDKTDGQNVEHTGRYSDAIFILKFLHSGLEFGTEER